MNITPEGGTMKRKLFFPTLLLACISCSEPTIPRGEVANNTPPKRMIKGSWQEGPQEAPEDAPAEYQISGCDIQVHAQAGFLEEGKAYGMSTVDYCGNQAVADVELSIFRGESSSGNPVEGHSQKQDALPWSRTLTARATMMLSMLCGYRDHAHATGEAWIELPGHTIWARQGDTADADAQQQSCVGGGGGGGGGTGDQYALLICETIDYYSGNGEYLGSEHSCRVEDMM